MAKNALYDMDATAANNLDIAGITLAENQTLPSQVNNFERAHLSQVKTFLNDLGSVNTVTGTANAPVVQLASNVTAVVDGLRFVFNAVGANTTAVTLTLKNSGGTTITTANVKKWVAGVATDLSANDISGASALVDVAYDLAATAFMVVSSSAGTTFATNAQAATATSTAVALTPANLAQERGYSNAPFSNLSLVASVAASALTFAVKGQDGNDPSVTNPVYVSFRSATLTSGLNAQLAITSALSLVISSGSTLGMTSAVAATLAIGIVNDAGTARLAVQNPLTLPLVDGIVSTTAEGGAGAADSAGVLYTGTAATSKAITYVGLAIVTEATAGTWATAPSAVQVGPAPAVANAFSRISLGIAVASTSGASIDFTGIGAAISGGARRITFEFIGLSTNGTSIPMVQIGDSGGVEATGYSGSSARGTGAGISSINMSTGFTLDATWAATNVTHGTLMLTLQNGATDWVATFNAGRSDAAAQAWGAGSKSLSPGPIDRIRLTTVGGTDTFDAGSVNITIE